MKSIQSYSIASNVRYALMQVLIIEEDDFEESSSCTIYKHSGKFIFDFSTTAEGVDLIRSA